MSAYTSKQLSWAIGGTIILAIVFGVLVVVFNKPIPPQKPAETIDDPSTLPGIQTGIAPWSAESAHLRDRLQAIGLPALSAEGGALHLHQHLDLIVHGQTISVPTGIGQGPGYISDIHTHDGSGIIHVESPETQTLTLGQFFDIWGVRFTSACLGGYCADSTNSLKVYVDGKEMTDDPRQLALAQHQKITVVYGTEEENPKVLPSYTFPPND